ncbi:hypothetical protein MPLA_760014 [Mesorhizobium sp. ORS 3359]|nr:hypothetical protein MPLA_760014 [Mesorhizobium sp. ORS 3359]
MLSSVSHYALASIVGANIKSILVPSCFKMPRSRMCEAVEAVVESPTLSENIVPALLTARITVNIRVVRC